MIELTEQLGGKDTLLLVNWEHVEFARAHTVHVTAAQFEHGAPIIGKDKVEPRTGSLLHFRSGLNVIVNESTHDIKQRVKDNSAFRAWSDDESAKLS